MFSKILVKTFIRDSENVQNTDVRNKYGYVAGVVGILSNLLLFVIKVFIGMLTSSIAIMADAFNNLSDMASSAITMIGFKLASKPADKEHPFWSWKNRVFISINSSIYGDVGWTSICKVIYRKDSKSNSCKI